METTESEETTAQPLAPVTLRYLDGRVRDLLISKILLSLPVYLDEWRGVPTRVTTDVAKGRRVLREISKEDATRLKRPAVSGFDG